MRFPSLNPILFNKTNPDIDAAENHKKAALAYQQWWYGIDFLRLDGAYKNVHPGFYNWGLVASEQEAIHKDHNGIRTCLYQGFLIRVQR